MSSFFLKSTSYTALLLLLISFLLQSKTYTVLAVCGDLECEASDEETCSNCPIDCGVCPTPTPTPTSGGGDGDKPAAPAPYTGPTRYPSVTLNPQSPDPTNKTRLTFSGTATIEHGTINLVQYSLDAGTTWLSASPTDEKFDQISEAFNFTPKVPFAEGRHTVYVRARALSQVYTQPSNYASDTFTVTSTPPEITLDEISPNPTNHQTPTIAGKATSRLARILRVEISFDNGETWIEATLTREKFTLTRKENFEDGNYSIIARATDSAGNTGRSQTQILVIDRIPPLIGGNMIALGPQTLLPNKNGVVRVVAGTKVTMAMSVKGGVTEVSLNSEDGTFALTNIAGTNLWSGEVNFEKPGEKLLKVSAVDGAGNITERELNSLVVEDFGQVLNKKNKNPVVGAEVSIYFFDSSTNSWVLWEGSSYGQKNPRKTDEAGYYSFMVPSGRYYLEVKAPGFKTMQSEILDVSINTIFNFNFPLTPLFNATFSLPLIGEVSITFPSFSPPQTLTKSELVRPEEISISNEYLLSPGTQVPDFLLPNLDGIKLSPSHLKGKTLVLTFLSFWSPHSLEQIPILDEISGLEASGPGGKQAVLGISLQESAAATEIFMRRGNYRFDVVSDINGETAETYKITTLPQHFFINSSGRIKEVYVGVLTKNEMFEKISKLE